VRNFFVTQKSSNATIVDDTITLKINVFRSQSAIDARNSNIRKTFVKCSTSKQNAQYAKNFTKLEADIVAFVKRKRKKKN
jgi:hypothetical protein